MWLCKWLSAALMWVCWLLVCSFPHKVTSMYAEERQQVILERARAKGRVDVAALAEEFDVTTETIRRDLTVLERHGVLRRVHGGAIPVERLGIEPAVEQRYEVNAMQKERIAKAALDQLPEGGSIILDAGTTTVRFAEILPSDREITVVTHALPIASMLAERMNITLHLVGGRIRPGTLAAVGSWSARELAEIFVDVAFLGTNGVSPTRGLTTPDLAEAAVKTALMRSARRTVVLADHSKFGREDFAHVADLSEVDTIITDSEVDADMAREIEEAGPEVVRV
jgi:DeoR family fructose operon transcriptional repressor